MVTDNMNRKYKKQVTNDDKDHHWMDGSFRDSGKLGWVCVFVIVGLILLFIALGLY